MSGTMETKSRKPSVGAIILSLLMLFFGIQMSGFGYGYLREWRSEGLLLIVCAAVWMLGGPAVCGAALWSLGTLGREPPVLRVGGMAIAVSGVALAVAAGVGTLQCSGPT